MAYSLGDSTAKDLGRLTLNPLKHLDPFGSVLLPLLLSFTGFVFGYAKPVPYNPLNLTDRKYGPIKVAAAGPLSNIALAVLFGVSLRFLPVDLLSTSLPVLLSMIVFTNLVLAIFNLFPIPPLDGHWFVVTLLPAQFNGLKLFLYRYSMPLLFFFIFFIFQAFSPLILWLFALITGFPAAAIL